MLAGVGGEAFERHRSHEFAAGEGDPADLLARLRAVIDRAVGIAEGLSPAELARPCEVQGHATDAFGALLHAVEHAAYHTGQIVHITKELLGEEGGIEFYPHLRGR